MLRQITQKKFPLRDTPKSGHLIIVEANHESGNHVEFLSETRQGAKRLDLLNDAADTEQARDFPEQWTRGLCRGQLQNDRVAVRCRESPPAPQPRSRMRLGRATSSSSWRIRRMLTPIQRSRFRYLGQSAPGSATAYRWRISSNLERIDCLNDALCLQREAVRARQPEGTVYRASQTLAVDQFLYFMAKLHSSHLVAKHNNFN